MLVDSHCHLHFIDYQHLNADINTVVKNARIEGISGMLCVCTELEQMSEILHITRSFDEIYASVGIHPTEINNNNNVIEEIEKWVHDTKVIAIGETGLDYYHLDTNNQAAIKAQQELFIKHILLAKKYNKPLIIHTRNARIDTLKLLKEYHASDVGGVLHCFTEDWDTAKNAMDLNFYISFSGIVTFKNAVELQKIAKDMPLDKMLIETDSPYLAPVPFRGKMNQPMYVKYVAKFIAELKGITLEEVANATTHNYNKLFFKI